VQPGLLERSAMNTSTHLINSLIQVRVFKRSLRSFFFLLHASGTKALFTWGMLPEKKLGGSVRPASQNPYSVYDQVRRFSPRQTFDTKTRQRVLV